MQVDLAQEPPAGETAELLGLLRRLYDDLSPQLRRAARYLLDRPEDIAFNSVREIAQRAGVQPATLVRLAQRLGYSGYDELRGPFRDRLRGRTIDYRSRARELQAHTGGRHEPQGLAELAAEMIAADRENLAYSLETVGAEALAAAASTMASARRLYVLGMRSLYPAALYVHYACRMFRDNTVLIDGRGGTFTDDLRGIDGRDVMLSFSIRPYTRGFVQATAYAAERGATIIAVTDSSISPLAPAARHVLRVATGSPALFQSVVPALAVAQVLVAQVLAQGGPRALAAVSQAEAQLARFEAYWPEHAVLEKTREASP